MAYWMKDVVQDLELFCGQNDLHGTQKSLARVEELLDEEIRLREETEMFPKAADGAGT